MGVARATRFLAAGAVNISVLPLGRGMLTMLAFIFGAPPDDGREMVGAPRVRRAGSSKAGK